MDDTLAEIISAQINANLAFRVVKLIMYHATTWSMRKIGWAVIHSENIWVARLFRRNATMLTHYAVYLVVTHSELSIS